MQLSDGEKLILVMLSEIHKALKIKDGIEPDFVLETIHNNHLWGLTWKYSGIPFSRQEEPHAVKEVVDAMDMWWFIEASYKKLSTADKKQLKKDADPFGEIPKFMGFDGNYETEHMSIARYLVEHLDRFGSFKRRDFNSHVPLVERYNRMYRLFEPMRPSLIGNNLLSVRQLTDLLKAEASP